jgi:hypothetical protein
VNCWVPPKWTEAGDGLMASAPAETEVTGALADEFAAGPAAPQA